MIARALDLAPIDDAARDGRFRLVFGGDAEFACVRWAGSEADGRWVFSSGHPLDFAPESYDRTSAGFTAGAARHG